MTEFLLNHTLYHQEYCFLWYLLFSINQLDVCCLHHSQHWLEILQDFQDRLQLHGALCSVLHGFFQWIFSPLFKATICTLVCFCHCRILAFLSIELPFLQSTAFHSTWCGYFLPVVLFCLFALLAACLWFFPIRDCLFHIVSFFYFIIFRFFVQVLFFKQGLSSG